jgi:hypothetical protein
MRSLMEWVVVLLGVCAIALVVIAWQFVGDDVGAAFQGVNSSMERTRFARIGGDFGWIGGLLLWFVMLGIAVSVMNWLSGLFRRRDD